MIALLVAINVTLVVTDVAELSLQCAVIAREMPNARNTPAQMAPCRASAGNGRTPAFGRTHAAWRYRRRSAAALWQILERLRAVL